jgi:hypothetical protein
MLYTGYSFMEKNVAVILILTMIILGSLPLAQPNEEEFPMGKELSFLLNEIITEYQIFIVDFIFEHKFLTAESQEEKLRILEEKTNELSEAVDDLNAQRALLAQELEEGTITDEEFALEIEKLATAAAAIAQSMSVLEECISEIIETIPEELQGRALTLVEKFNRMAAAMSELTTMFHETGGREQLEIPEIPDSPEDTGKEGSGSPEDTGKEGSGSPEDTGKPEDPGKPRKPGLPKNLRYPLSR